MVLFLGMMILSKRLGELTQNDTKCMVQVDGVRLIERTLRILDRNKLNRIILVVGYQYEHLVEFVDSLNINTPIEYIVNDVYYKTNNIFSLALAKEKMVEDDTLLL